ncbi:hypothetical protein HRR83_004670 [Exophiala dermatitidis]|uniref:DUF7924 domain-containing protein n=2 Tax=Exophiala dermatitidis TaxID=5970 RepID=H6BRS3_EXODN|nr:uncharacterized protein HMPREF1120_02202 [Exophiala dermatitidis NIH/UT8656]KAJ4515628.1 hypothetical protein HRR75_003707 [Exophiala dermatitidis]EHY54025.1 hypothetical protein HMPREF1120_02202 [Exophiala dermatitidis NIH/UT8656]KAJ4519308.1 hypothetical protein HRR74_004049 [Exophiala dermatitidis]KAJ4529124.1 hypothetical protein HRR73_000144 [Exophiala dermatitidis]KAJ4538524.1 hypothetical protein HRR77_007007 [Exophiala dermatitidis]
MDIAIEPDKETITIKYTSSEPLSTSAGDCMAAAKTTAASDLPPFCYDGSHLSWRQFRQQVLGPHRIRIMESAPGEKIPASLVELVEADLPNASRYIELKHAFREQVKTGRGFGPSPIFPPNLLPSIDDEARLARCMIPCFSRETLPERALNQMGPFYELQVPRSGLGCGFSSSALSAEETAVLPPWLVATGTIVHFDTGYISPGAALYCPFLIFERAYGEKEKRFEAANNQSAVGGACCVRALHMLYAKAWKGQLMPELPVAFSCVIDNAFAVLNIHWIDHGQAYCMSPLCKFDLSKDEHFHSFLVWVDAIGKWALAHLLPMVKTALGRLRSQRDTPPPTPPAASASTSAVAVAAAAKLTLDTGAQASVTNDTLIKSLKTTFDNIPWRFEDDEFTPVSSSTASWGSPLTATAMTFGSEDGIVSGRSSFSFSNVAYPPRRMRPPTPISTSFSGVYAPSQLRTPTTTSFHQHRRLSQVDQAHGQGQGQGNGTPPPAYNTCSNCPAAATAAIVTTQSSQALGVTTSNNPNPDLVWQKRLSHAMDEIRDLQRQLLDMKNQVAASTESLQTELAEVKTAMSSVLRKETLTRSLLRQNGNNGVVVSSRSSSISSIDVHETWSVMGLGVGMGTNLADGKNSNRTPLKDCGLSISSAQGCLGTATDKAGDAHEHSCKNDKQSLNPSVPLRHVSDCGTEAPAENESETQTQTQTEIQTCVQDDVTDAVADADTDAQLSSSYPSDTIKIVPSSARFTGMSALVLKYMPLPFPLPHSSILLLVLIWAVSATCSYAC